MGIWEALFGRKKIQEVSNEADAGFTKDFEVNKKNLKKIEEAEAAADTDSAKAAGENAPAAEDAAEPAAAAAPAAEEAEAVVEAAAEEAETVVEAAAEETKTVVEAAAEEAETVVEAAAEEAEAVEAATEEAEAVETVVEEAEAAADDDVIPAAAAAEEVEAEAEEEAGAEAETAEEEAAAAEAEAEAEEEAGAEAETAEEEAAAAEAEAEAEEEAGAEAETAEAEVAAEDNEAESETVAAEEAPAAEPEPVKTAPETALDITNIEPQEVFRYFKIICDIPHGSFNTEGISNFLVKFAAGHNYKCTKDDKGNVIIFAPATPGCEKAPALILQGHMDMVCEKAPGCDADMTKDPIKTLVEGDWLTADETTLGLDVSELKGRRMLNMDSESEGAFTVGCAGGADLILAVHGRRSEKSGRVLKIKVSGLLGGHSGEMIGAGRANADLLMARILYTLYRKTEFRLLSVQGGNKDNAIPREAEASLLFPSAVDRKKVKKQIKEIRKALKNEYAVCDPGLTVKADWVKENTAELRPAFTKNDTRKFIRFLMAAPNGVIEYTPGLAGMPQTSLNLGILTTAADGISAEFLVRSSVNSQKQMMMDRLSCIAAQFEGSVRIVGQYPAWEYRTESDFRDLLQGVFKDTYGKDAAICVTHGGLECGLLAAKMPGLDAVSIGPEMSGIHTPDEKLNIPSVQRTWQFLIAALEACGRE